MWGWCILRRCIRGPCIKSRRNPPRGAMLCKWSISRWICMTAEWVRPRVLRCFLVGKIRATFPSNRRSWICVAKSSKRIWRNNWPVTSRLMVSSTSLTAGISLVVSAYSRLISVAVWLDRSNPIWRSTLLIVSMLMESSTSLTPEISHIMIACSGLISTAVWLDPSSRIAS